MNEIILTINLLIAVCAILYMVRRGEEERKSMLREITTAFLSRNAEEYAQVLPADDKPLPMNEEDEIVDIDEVSEKILIKQLQEEIDENNKS